MSKNEGARWCITIHRGLSVIKGGMNIDMRLFISLHLMQRAYRFPLIPLAAAIVASVLLLVGCQKKPILEVEQLHSALHDVKNRCASVYAADDLEQIQPLIDDMDSLAGKGKRKNTAEKAREAMAILERIEEKTERRKTELRMAAEAAKERAESEVVQADKELSRTYAKELLLQAEEFLNKGTILLRRSDCSLEESHAFFVISAEHSIMAKEQSIAERERIALEEAEKWRLEALKEVKPAEKKEIREWIVKTGDSLWKIAAEKEIYDNPLLWPLIFWANRSQIKEPDVIYDGQKLKIPRNVKVEEVEQALRKAKTGNVSHVYNSANGQ